MSLFCCPLKAKPAYHSHSVDLLLFHWYNIVQLTIGLVTIFVITTVSVVVGCWCGKKRKQYQTDVSDEGIPNEDNGGKQEVGLRLSMLDERKVAMEN